MQRPFFPYRELAVVCLIPIVLLLAACGSGGSLLSLSSADTTPLASPISGTAIAQVTPAINIGPIVGSDTVAIVSPTAGTLAMLITSSNAGYIIWQVTLASSVQLVTYQGTPIPTHGKYQYVGGQLHLDFKKNGRLYFSSFLFNSGNGSLHPKQVGTVTP